MNKQAGSKSKQEGTAGNIFAVDHRTAEQLLLTVSDIMNNESDAHCQDNQGYKGDEANNPGLQTHSSPSPHHSWPMEESK